ncbi:MAG: ATP-binding cassette domain-containing protein [Thermodesulfobacteriota bacterium]|jgi:ABC-type sugar transport system ATPase subunit
MNNYLVRMENISKHFGGKVALEQAHLELSQGEVLGLVGDNGAGKSTMLKILAGVAARDGGDIFIGGQKVSINSPRQSRSLGIEMVYQDLSLCGSLTVWENIYLGRYIVRPLRILDKNRMSQKALQFLQNLGIDLYNINEPVRNLSGGQQQAIAICRCLLFQPEVILLDEPTASMALVEQERVLKLIIDLKDQGRSLVMVTHNLQELFRVADRALVLKGGRNVWCGPLKRLKPDDLAQMMFVGRGGPDVGGPLSYES